VFFNFWKPDELPDELVGRFDCVVIDPPFVTREVWELYARAARRLLRADGGGQVVATTLFENGALVQSLFSGSVGVPVRPRRFLPGVPNLPYQYRLYSNVEGCDAMDTSNPDIPSGPEVEALGQPIDSDMLQQGKQGSGGAEEPPPQEEAALHGGGSDADFEKMIEAALAAETAAGHT
jgi:hypothetical protein